VALILIVRHDAKLGGPSLTTLLGTIDAGTLSGTGPYRRQAHLSLFQLFYPAISNRQQSKRTFNSFTRLTYEFISALARILPNPV
jgi:hypothetical protein